MHGLTSCHFVVGSVFYGSWFLVVSTTLCQNSKGAQKGWGPWSKEEEKLGYTQQAASKIKAEKAK